MKKKETWKFILQTLAAIVSAILTSLGVSSCLVWDEGTNKRMGAAQREQTPSGVLRDLLEDSRQEQTQP